jgi:hypothetical protein
MGNDLIIAIAAAMIFVRFMTFGCSCDLLMLGLIDDHRVRLAILNATWID